MRKKNTYRNLLVTFVYQIVYILCGLVIPQVIINKFGSETNGLITSVTQFITYITIMESGFGLAVKAMLYKPLAKNDKSKITSILYTTNSFFKKLSKILIVYVVILCFVYPFLINSSFSYTYTISLILIIAISVFAESFFGMSYKLYLQAAQKTYVVSLIQLITYVVNTAIILILLKFNSSIHLIKLVGAALFLMRPIIQKYIVEKKYEIKIDKNCEKIEIENKKESLSQHVAGIIYNNIDVFLLSIVSKLSVVSVYSIYSLIISNLKKIIDVMTIGTDAAFGDMYAKGEIKNLLVKFRRYEFLYYTITTIIFTSAAILIIPFLSIYTRNFKDENYLLPVFAFVFTLTSLIFSIKSIYNSLAFDAGKIKETSKGAWIEVIVNLFISLILVKKYGMVGVTLGTLISAIIRGSEFLLVCSKSILYTSSKVSIKRALISIFEFCLIYFIQSKYLVVSTNSYLEWIIVALIVTICVTIIILIINILFNFDEIRKGLMKK